jgi:hypothetical protein
LEHAAQPDDPDVVLQLSDAGNVFCVVVQRRWFLDRKFIFLLEQADGLLRSGSSHAIGNPYPTVRSRLRIA